MFVYVFVINYVVFPYCLYGILVNMLILLINLETGKTERDVVLTAKDLQT